jgi:hypothetical protein
MLRVISAARDATLGLMNWDVDFSKTTEEDVPRPVEPAKGNT